MPDPQPLAQTHPREVWAAFAGAVTLILMLVAELYRRLNKDNSDLWAQIELLRKGEKDCEVRQGQMATEITNLKAEDQSIYIELDRLDDGQRETDSKLTTLIAEHNSCIPRKLSMKGMQQP